jgi:hypothetical protein
MREGRDFMDLSFCIRKLGTNELLRGLTGRNPSKNRHFGFLFKGKTWYC